MRSLIATAVSAMVLALAGCGDNPTERAATGGLGGAVVAGPAGAVVGGTIGAATAD
ncbi:MULTISPECIES: hypothetical protein [Paracoccus]|jgi:hypothetical protein|uniref:hypothetical protein n=1 Tax=Paracoccus TaxID=265 RepID=UPI00032578F5|nr:MULTISPECIES: hypothetical protein [Paracoccus]MBB4629458.1 outer membrane lipoprotein SlyB [Paracoccus denitrificans]MCU7430706.1 hypothetical protein [Paracoccus denitrificans]MDK8874961.1 hypothetical protein [Paracoccus sp. SSJ]UFS64945.1 hypothetical protein LO749_12485 [Paracoccus denitrificans]UPV94034.1 hypothetical protein M0K93_09120 [Paracoccus denitrificans]